MCQPASQVLVLVLGQTEHIGAPVATALRQQAADRGVMGKVGAVEAPPSRSGVPRLSEGVLLCMPHFCFCKNVKLESPADPKVCHRLQKPTD